VQIECPSSRGAGFFLSENLVVTAKHVIEDCQFPMITNSRGQKTSTISIAQSRSKDLAYLTVKESIATSVLLAEPPEIGSVVYTVGSPIEGLLLSKGTLSNVFTNLTEDWLVLDIPADHGSSGGPVFSNEGLVGLVILKDKQSGEIYAYTSREIKQDYEYVKSFGKNGERSSPPMGISNFDPLMPTLVASSMTFLLGLGLGILTMRIRRRERSSKPRIRIEV
jgi:hypothetical protein